MFSLQVMAWVVGSWVPLVGPHSDVWCSLGSSCSAPSPAHKGAEGYLLTLNLGFGKGAWGLNWPALKGQGALPWCPHWVRVAGQGVVCVGGGGASWGGGLL
jgi:hypothetical protein